jgi:type III restriction enzyme
MFYKLIKNKCEEWMKSSDCTIRELIQYIYTKNKMRDAQIEAIKIYLFLKIACGNKPLWQLFIEGRFNSLDLCTMELTVEAREILTANKAAASLLEYSLLTDKNGKQLAPELEKVIKSQREYINYEDVFKKT